MRFVSDAVMSKTAVPLYPLPNLHENSKSIVLRELKRCLDPTSTFLRTAIMSPFIFSEHAIYLAS